MNAFKRICSAALGLVLFLAGLLKLMDPVGAGLVADEYLRFFHLGFLRFAAPVLGSLLAYIECAAGAALITGVWRRVTCIFTGVLLGFFTLVTLVLLIFNPPMDCGCFGEAVHLSHRASFLKNLVLVLVWLAAFAPFRRFGEPQRSRYVSFTLALVSSALFLLYSALTIPLVDFASYKPGTFLAGALEYDDYGLEGQPLLPFIDARGDYADSLALEGRVMIVSAFNGLDAGGERRTAAFLDAAAAEGVTPLFIASGTPSSLAEKLSVPTLLSYSYSGDRRMLMTLNRSNGGATLLCDGQVTAKWPASRLPDAEKLSYLGTKDPVEVMHEARDRDRVRLQGFLIYVLAVMFFI